MAFAQGFRGRFSYVAEVTYGTTPASPTMLSLRITGHTLKLDKDTFVSEEIRSDRQISDARHGMRGVSGQIQVELSYSEFDAMLESGLLGTWTSNVLKAGTTVKSFTFEDAFMDLTPQYNVYTGCVVNSISVNIQPNGMVKATLEILGKNMTTSTTSLGSPTASTTTPPFDGFTGAIKEGGSTIAKIASLEFKIDNGFEPAKVVGSNTTPQMILGRSDLKGTVNAYFDDVTLLNKFINETESSLEVTLDGLSSGDLVILIPRIKYTGADLPQEKGARMLNLPFQALRDATEATNIKITRVP